MDATTQKIATADELKRQITGWCKYHDLSEIPESHWYHPAGVEWYDEATIALYVEGLELEVIIDEPSEENNLLASFQNMIFAHGHWWEAFNGGCSIAFFNDTLGC